jgi:hypothetical protein
MTRWDISMTSSKVLQTPRMARRQSRQKSPAARDLTAPDRLGRPSNTITRFRAPLRTQPRRKSRAWKPKRTQPPASSKPADVRPAFPPATSGLDRSEDRIVSRYSLGLLRKVRAREQADDATFSRTDPAPTYDPPESTHSDPFSPGGSRGHAEGSPPCRRRRTTGLVSSPPFGLSVWLRPQFRECKSHYDDDFARMRLQDIDFPRREKSSAEAEFDGVCAPQIDALPILGRGLRCCRTTHVQEGGVFVQTARAPFESRPWTTCRLFFAFMAARRHSVIAQFLDL